MLPEDVAEALNVRAETAKSSVAKLDAMFDYAGGGNRIFDSLQYCGAAKPQGNAFKERKWLTIRHRPAAPASVW